MNNEASKCTAISATGYEPTPYGGRIAVGVKNGRGGVSLAHFNCDEAKEVSRLLAGNGIQSVQFPSGSAGKLIVAAQ